MNISTFDNLVIFQNTGSLAFFGFHRASPSRFQIELIFQSRFTFVISIPQFISKNYGCFFSVRFFEKGWYHRWVQVLNMTYKNNDHNIEQKE